MAAVSGERWTEEGERVPDYREAQVPEQQEPFAIVGSTCGDILVE